MGAEKTVTAQNIGSYKFKYHLKLNKIKENKQTKKHHIPNMDTKKH